MRSASSNSAMAVAISFRELLKTPLLYHSYAGSCAFVAGRCTPSRVVTMEWISSAAAMATLNASSRAAMARARRRRTRPRDRCALAARCAMMFQNHASSQRRIAASSLHRSIPVGARRAHAAARERAAFSAHKRTAVVAPAAAARRKSIECARRSRDLCSPIVTARRFYGFSGERPQGCACWSSQRRSCAHGSPRHAAHCPPTPSRHQRRAANCARARPRSPYADALDGDRQTPRWSGRQRHQRQSACRNTSTTCRGNKRRSTARTRPSRFTAVPRTAPKSRSAVYPRPLPWNIHVPAAASPRPVSTEYSPRRPPASTEYPRRYVERRRSVRDGQLPPLRGRGHG